MGITNVSRVIGISKLKTKFKQYEAKRQLCSSYDVFLSDNRVLPLLPHLIGKVFFEKKKQPLAVDLRSNNWKAEINKALSSTPFYLAEGLCSRLHVANTNMPRDAIVENIVQAMDSAAKIIPGGWKGIQALHIRTHDSIALPIYNSLPVRRRCPAPSSPFYPSPPPPPPPPIQSSTRAIVIRSSGSGIIRTHKKNIM